MCKKHRIVCYWLNISMQIWSAPRDRRIKPSDQLAGWLREEYPELLFWFIYIVIKTKKLWGGSWAKPWFNWVGIENLEHPSPSLFPLICNFVPSWNMGIVGSAIIHTHTHTHTHIAPLILLQEDLHQNYYWRLQLWDKWHPEVNLCSKVNGKEECTVRKLIRFQIRNKISKVLNTILNLCWHKVRR